VEVATILAGMVAVNALMAHLLPEGIAVDRFDPINEAIFTVPFRAHVSIDVVLVEFPTEGRRVLTGIQGPQVNARFLSFGKRDVVPSEEKGKIFW
jgi:hypothetical protein